MAQLVGCLAMSHAPQLMLPPDKWGLLNNRGADALPERPELSAKATRDLLRSFVACRDGGVRIR